MKNSYPDKKELKKIKEWEIHDFMNLIDYIKDLWSYDSIKCYWRNTNKSGYKLTVELVTVGWSGNEDIIEALLENNMFRIMWYAEWHRGGKHVFEIDPEHVGYKLVSNYCKENKISRQSVYQSKHRYYFIKVSKKIVFVREKFAYIETVL